MRLGSQKRLAPKASLATMACLATLGLGLNAQALAHSPAGPKGGMHFPAVHTTQSLTQTAQEGGSITPAQLLNSVYGQKAAQVLAAKSAYRESDLSRGCTFLQSLDRAQLHTPIPVEFDKDLPVAGDYSPDEHDIRIQDRKEHVESGFGYTLVTPGTSEHTKESVLRHEGRHAMQREAILREWAQESPETAAGDFYLLRDLAHETSKGPLTPDELNYATDPAEMEVRMADLNHLHMQREGRPLLTPQDSVRALHATGMLLAYDDVAAVFARKGLEISPEQFSDLTSKAPLENTLENRQQHRDSQELKFIHDTLEQSLDQDPAMQRAGRCLFLEKVIFTAPGLAMGPARGTREVLSPAQQMQLAEHDTPQIA